MILNGKNLSVPVLLAILCCMVGCSRKSTLSSSKSDYREDLSSVRPRYDYVEPVVSGKGGAKKEPVTSAPKTGNNQSLNVNKKLEAALDTMARQNKAIRYISGFRIQIYVGNVRQEADNAKSYVYQSFPELTPYVSYSQPTYRVKVGDFMYRSDAEQYLDQIRLQYGSAVILADRVEIRKSLMVNVSEQN